jgi:hypothetical protein
MAAAAMILRHRLFGAAFGSEAMRIGPALLILLSCAGCAWSQKPVAQNATPPQAAALTPAPVADASPPRFECSDGTISVSQTGCLLNMARARLPPGQPADPTPTGSIPAASEPSTSATGR